MVENVKNDIIITKGYCSKNHGDFSLKKKPGAFSFTFRFEGKLVQLRDCHLRIGNNFGHSCTPIVPFVYKEAFYINRFNNVNNLVSHFFLNFPCNEN